MTNRDDEEQIEDDPRIANIYRRMRLLVGVSLLIMGAGFFVVLGVIVYRLSTQAPRSEAMLTAGLGLPADARLVSMTADGGHLFLAVESDGAVRVHVLDARTLAETGRVELGSAPPPAAVPLAAPAASR